MVSRLTEVASVSFLGHWGAGVLGVSFYGAYIAKKFCPEAGSGAQTGVSTPVPYTRSCPDKARPFSQYRASTGRKLAGQALCAHRENDPALSTRGAEGAASCTCH